MSGPRDLSEAWWKPGEPAFVSIPPGRVGSYADEVCEIAEMMGRPLEPHQITAVDAFNSYGRGGKWLALECCIVGPRQTTGKTSSVILPSVLASLLLWEENDRAMWTSHRMKTTLDTFRDLKVIIEGSEEFSRRVRTISETDGEQAVYFTNGSWLEFGARSEGAGRGLAGKEVIADEALFFSAAMAGDLLPALASRSNPRVMYGSSAPKGTSAHLHDLMARGRAGDPTVCYVEFRCPGSLELLRTTRCATPQCDHARDAVGCGMDDESLLLYGSPSLVTGRCSITVVRALRKALTPLEYGREMLGYEEAPVLGHVTIPLAKFLARVDVDSEIDGPRALSFDIPPDRESASIGGAGRRADGDVHAALIESRRGVRWLVPRLLELIDDHDPVAVVVDGASPAATEIKALEEAGLEQRTAANPEGRLVVLTASEMGRACGTAFDGIAGPDPTVWHVGDPLVQTALTGAVPRPLGDGLWGFGRKRSDVDISPIVAMVEAIYGLSTTPDTSSGLLVAWR